MADQIPVKLQEIIDDFRWCQGREKVELLIQFSQSLAPMPEWVREKNSELEQVHECMTPVFVYVENRENKLFFHFDVPESAPTVRGFAALMQQGLNGSTPEEILAVPANFYQEMRLQQVISHQRMGGMSAILGHMKKLATTNLEYD